MLSFRLATLNSAEASSDVLAALELAAFFLGEAGPEDLPIDEDEARNWYIEEFVEDNSKADYRAEPQMADTEMIESLTNALQALAAKRAEALGIHYPFALAANGVLTRRNDQGLDAVGASYLSLQFFRALYGKTIEIEGANDAEIKQRRDAFDKNFRKVFEYVAGYSVAGKMNGAPFMTSNCRSSERLESLLINVCQKVGSGAVKPYALWSLQQRTANDGGVDCLLHVGGPGVPGDAEVTLIGATVQKGAIEQKIMGQEKVNIFKHFFSKQPAAFRGVLVRPQDEDELSKEKCVTRDCLLYSYEQVWMGMGRRAGGPYQAQMLCRLDAKVRHLLREFLGSALLHEYEKHEIPAV